MKYISSQLYVYLQSVQAYISPPIAAVFLIGLAWRRVNAKGAMASLIAGFFLGMGRLVLELTKESQSGWLYWYADINFLHFAIVLFLVCSAVLVVVSLLTPAQSDEKLAGMTFATAHMPHEGAGDLPASDPAWRRKDFWFSVLLVLCVAAFWLLGCNIEDVGWPACGEIDILEGKGRLPRWTSGALHRGPSPAENLVSSWQHELDSGTFHGAWHRFSVDWSPETIQWFVDDEPMYVFEKSDQVEPTFWPFDHGHAFFIILNLAVGGWFDEGKPPPADMSPKRLEVDYVRVYRQITKEPHPATTD